jgi:hypothetical protein
MPSITTWARIEPRARTSDYNKGMQARLRDPLWLLARQWQFGEFRGDDAGTPVNAEVTTESARLSMYRAGRLDSGMVATGTTYDSNALPIETLVEREVTQLGKPVTSARNRRRDAEAGLHFLRLLDAKGLSNRRADYVKRYAFRALDATQWAALDGATQRFFTLMTGRVPDGALLYTDLKAGLYPLATTTDLDTTKQVAADWLKWYETLFNEAPANTTTGWNAEHMEYEFTVSAGGPGGQEVVLGAAEYAEGSLDWYSFVQKPGARLGAKVGSETVIKNLAPTPLSFHGMPARRFWELEDGRLDFGAVKAAPEDLGRMMLVEFALAYGNDWFLLPVELAVGSISRVASLKVMDTFNVSTIIRSSAAVDGADTSWRLFTVATDPRAATTGVADLLFLPPALGNSLQSRPIEDVLFLRDEMANMAWGVERLVESASGLTLDRHAAYQEQRARREGATPPAPATQNATLRYLLQTSVPDYWIPLLPRQTDQNAPLRLKRATMPDTKAKPKGRVLEPERDPFWLSNEEVPREGARVTRAYQYTRWSNGATYLWIGRRKQPGRGEGSSGLRFDSLEES